MQVHGDWVCKVKYCPTMEYLMSCSGDSNSSLYRGDVRGRKEGSLFRVRKGVATFDYCKDWNIIGKGRLYLYTEKSQAIVPNAQYTYTHLAS